MDKQKEKLDIYMVLMLESELIVWGRSPVKELKERSLQQIIDIIPGPELSPNQILTYFTSSIWNKIPSIVTYDKSVDILNHQKHML